MLFRVTGARDFSDPRIAESALRIGSALAYLAQDISLGRNTERRSTLLYSLILAGILGSGGRACTAGCVPTPTLAYSTRERRAGCMITALANEGDNEGVRLFNPDGSPFGTDEISRYESVLQDYHWSDWEHQGEERAIDALTPHRVAILDSREIRQGLSVIVDCGNGSGSVITPTLLRDAGIQVIPLNCDARGGDYGKMRLSWEDRLTYISSMVRKSGAHGAILHNGNADRLLACDNQGRYIPSDQLLALFALYLGSRKIVTTQETTPYLEEIGDVRRIEGQDIAISEGLIQWGDLGGDSKGAFIFPEISLTPDGPFAAALFCEIAGEWNIAEVIDAMPTDPSLRRSQICTER